MCLHNILFSKVKPNSIHKRNTIDWILIVWDSSQIPSIRISDFCDICKLSDLLLREIWAEKNPSIISFQNWKKYFSVLQIYQQLLCHKSLSISQKNQNTTRLLARVTRPEKKFTKIYLYGIVDTSHGYTNA